MQCNVVPHVDSLTFYKETLNATMRKKIGCWIFIIKLLNFQTNLFQQTILLHFFFSIIFISFWIKNPPKENEMTIGFRQKRKNVKLKIGLIEIHLLSSCIYRFGEWKARPWFFLFSYFDKKKLSTFVLHRLKMMKFRFFNLKLQSQPVHDLLIDELGHETQKCNITSCDNNSFQASTSRMLDSMTG